MAHPRRHLLLSLALLFVGPAAVGPAKAGHYVLTSAQTPPPAPPVQQPTFRTGVDLVRVDVIVTDRRGGAVTDLTRVDFGVFENGARQEIASLEFVSATGGAAAGGEPAWPIRSREDTESAIERGARLFVIFLDEYHVLRGRNTVVLREALAAFVRNELGPTDLVALMYPYTSIHDLQFTRDREMLAQEIDKFEGRADDFFPRRPIEQQHGRDIARLRNEVVLTALAGLATHLQGYGTGRKAVILGTQGFVSGGWRDAAEFYQRLKDVYAGANRGNTAIYPLDPSGLMMAAQPGVEPLRVLADQTTGVALVNHNNLRTALGVVTRDASGYYLIGYYPSEVKADGKWREIDVRVSRRGLEVRARKGYAALTPAEAASRLAPVVEPSPAALGALTALASPRGGRVIGTWVGFEIDRQGTVRARFAWEPGLLASADPVQVSITATAGGVRVFQGPVPAQPALAAMSAAGAAVTNGPGERRQVVFDVPSGPLEIAIDVQSAGLTHRERLALTAPDPAATPLGLDTPRVILTRNTAEYRAARADVDAIPVTRREFRRTDRLLVRFGAHGAAAANAAVSARVLNRRGEALADLPATTMRSNGGGHYELDLPLSSFAEGEFLLQIRAEAAGSEATQLIALRIIS